MISCIRLDVVRRAYREDKNKDGIDRVTHGSQRTVGETTEFQKLKENK